MNYYNPFAEVIETPDFPHAKTLRSTFSDKLSDTYWVFFGRQSLKEDFVYHAFLDPSAHQDKDPDFGTIEHYQKTSSYYGEPHLGIVDYCSGFFTTASNKLWGWTHDRLNKQGPAWSGIIAFACVIPAFLLVVISTAVRGIMSVALTLAFSPLIAFVHAISEIISAPIKSRANKLQLESTNDTLGDYLEQTNNSYNTVFVKLSEENLTLSSKYDLNPKTALLHKYDKTKTKDINHDAIKALFQLNINNINQKHQMTKGTIIPRPVATLNSGSTGAYRSLTA